MTTYRAADPVQKLVVGFAGGTLVLVIAMFGWWANRLQDTTDKLASIQALQAVQLAEMRQMVAFQGQEIERTRHDIEDRR